MTTPPRPFDSASASREPRTFWAIRGTHFGANWHIFTRLTDCEAKIERLRKTHTFNQEYEQLQLIEMSAPDKALARIAELDQENASIHVQWIEERDTLREKLSACEHALRILRNEVRGTLGAHELAIRYDSGNSNWECLEIALKQAEDALTAEARPAQREGGE